MHIAIIGSGYVGLVSGVCLAGFGHTVICTDKDAGRIAKLNAGEMPIYEPGLDEIVEENVAQHRLSFSTDVAAAVRASDVVFICVGTPARRGDGFADLSFVHECAREIAHHLDGYKVIVTKSTVPVGTGDEVERILRESAPDKEFGVVSNPEFLREGAAIDDFRRPDRIVIGVNDERAREVMELVYRPLYLNRAPFLFTDRRSAEIIKYASNAFLAAKITFINEVADLCEAVGANVQDVARGMGLDNRIGSKFLHAGPGYGGSCFPKDTVALIRTGEEHGAPLRIVETVAAVNDRRKRSMARKIANACGGEIRDLTIAILGLTFKPKTDDMREAPSIPIVQGLIDLGAKVRAYDPQGARIAKGELPDVQFASDPYDCAAGADALVIVTEWDMFRALDLNRIKSLLARPNFIDLRNIYDPEDVEAAGLSYTGIGRVSPGHVAKAGQA
ncbi:UDP-glucose/GDP-mannose dehydrogenase family protein [Mesorhizobium sp. BAC0120]|uniref:UDP-glucose dehydrogenase family protein n=1 Tax=Mesorhizobium sp. BAC0120 TaxID=3090670 RepID=UPI00298CA96C|nr:UDP-glucose/GDP-mannose dehydrogenase family protein [Mesorhizobium sp. BAC0120]MDW6021550.1 UDP-glucose/GDP-mannose dehydrogenase family protein [Mesorhizobium sp. BAC0120]